MTDQPIPRCPYCGSEQLIQTECFQGVYASAICCTNGGCAASGPLRESEKKALAEELALEAYMRAFSTLDELVTIVEALVSTVKGRQTVRPTSILSIARRAEKAVCRLMLDLDRRAGVGHNWRSPGGMRKQ